VAAQWNGMPLKMHEPLTWGRVGYALG
jgi:hypothetical protein